MVPSATQVGYRLTAAVWDFPSTGLGGPDPHAVSPVRVVVAPTALELPAHRAQAEPASTAASSSLQPPHIKPWASSSFVGDFAGASNNLTGMGSSKLQ